MANQVALNYYPSVKQLIQVEDLPEILSFLEGGIESLLSNLYFDNYQSSKSIDGSTGFYSLNIISPKKLQLELPGTGLALVFNPDLTNGSISSFPLTIFWRWEILRVINNFKATSFSFSPHDIFKLLIDFFQLNNQDL